jgi:hypothetical protein
LPLEGLSSLKPKGIPREAQEAKKQASNLKLITFGTLGILGLGAAFKDGLKNGFHRIADISNGISNIFAVPISLLFPFATLDNERIALREEKRSKDDLLNRMVYTAASLGFAPNTWGDPLKMGTRSTAHMIATLINLPHTLFTFFSYTGGRVASFWKVLEKRIFSKKNAEQQYRLEQEFDAFFRLGNLGSAQASVIPMSGQFILGWETLLDIFKGDFRSAWDRFKHEPVSVFLGTVFNSWAWPFEYVGKLFDTSIRTLESVEQFENAFKRSDSGSRMINYLKEKRSLWHKASQDENNPVGKVLKYGREFSKVEALLLPPLGMVSVVLPTFNRFLKGEFWNKEAQELDGAFGKTIGVLDKAFNVGAFFSHLYYTWIYVLSVRLPQTVTTSIFYGTHLLNKFLGKNVEPTEVRDKFFDRGVVKKLSDWAAKKLDKLETELHDKADRILISETGRCRHIRNFAEAIAEEVCYLPIREEYYEKEVEKEYPLVAGKPNSYKAPGAKPTDEQWSKVLGSKKVRDEILSKVRSVLVEYLRKSLLLNQDKIDYFMEHEHESIYKQVEKLLKDEIEKCKLSKPTVSNESKKAIQSKSLIELLTNPKELWEVAKLRTFHVTHPWLPLWIKGFVNVVDYGRPGEPFWLRNIKAQESGIREGDVQQACNREFMPVVSYAFQSMGKGLALLYRLKRLAFNGEALPAMSE